MKKLLFLLGMFICLGIAAKSQVSGTYQIKGADSVKMWKQSGYTELILQNKTKDTLGFLFNTGNGLTEFRRVMKKVNDTTYVFGGDTLILGFNSGDFIKNQLAFPQTADYNISGYGKVGRFFINSPLSDYGALNIRQSTSDVGGISLQTDATSKSPAITLGRSTFVEGKLSIASANGQTSAISKIGDFLITSNLTGGRIGITTGNKLDRLSLLIDTSGKIGINALAPPAFGLDLNSTFRIVPGNIPFNASMDTVAAFDPVTGQMYRTLKSSGTGITGINSQTGPTLLFQTGTTGTDFTLNIASNVFTINLPTASSANTGKLSNTDWSTFNNKLNPTLNSANIFVGNGSNVATGVVMSGDATLNNSGVLTIGNGAITYAKIQNVNSGKLLGRFAGTNGVIQEITLGSNITLNSGTGVLDVTAGTGDASTNTSTSVDGEIALFSSTTGKILKRATGTGFVKTTNGVYSTQASINLGSDIIGILPIVNGGTNSNVSLSNNRIMKSLSGSIVEAAAITANRALISDANGIPIHSTVTNTELSYLSGVTSSIQTQIDNKLSNITSLISAGTNVTITGTGVSGDPYVINSSGGGGGGTVTNVTGTSNRITVATGTTTPVVDIAATYVGQSSITTLGTIGTGVWNGTAIGAIYGGTGQTTVTTGDLLYGSASNTWSKLADVATGNVLISGGVSTAPSWGKVGLTTHVSGILPVANGGTGTSTPGLVAGTNITITGTWPNQTINSTGGGSGVTTMAAIGSSPNANGATISGSTLNLQPASSSFGGVVTTGDQTIAGDKSFIGQQSNFNGYGPKLNTQMLAPAKDMDSIYVSGKYLGFGFCGVFKSGVRVMIFVKADNHVGGNSIIMRGRSFDQGRTYTIDTLINELHGGVNDTLVTMGGGGIGPDNRLIIFYKRFRFSSPNFFPIDQRIVLSDDEGTTLFGDQVVSAAGYDEYLPYGGLVHCANGELLLPWYGQIGSSYKVNIIKSTDGGLTWGSSINVFNNTTSLRDETTFEHVGGGVIVGLMRGDSSNITYGQVISYDNGNTWSYQGQVSFGISGTPAWLSAFRSQNGKMALACYYRVGTDIRALYSYADSVILGPSHWDLTKEVTIATNVQGSGYINIVHPYQSMEGWGYYYDETVAQTNATIKWVKVPLGGAFPIGVGTGISGLTTDFIPVATSSTALGNSGLKWNAGSTALVGNGATGNTWTAHNGLVFETQKAALLVSDNGYINALENFYLDTDYKYKTNAAGGLLAMVAGRLHFYNAPAGSANAVASLSERFSIRLNGDYWINNSPGTAGQALVSGGSGNPTTWATINPSQWVNVTGGINFPGAGGNVGINTSTPIAPLHITGNTSGNNTTVIIDDDNSTIGSSIAFGYRSMTSPLKKYFGWVMDNNGMNFVKYLSNTPASPSTLMLLAHSGSLIINSTTDNSVGTLQVNGKITVATHTIGSNSDSAIIWDRSTNEYKIAKINGGSGGITTINSQTGSTQTIAAGFGIAENSSSNTHTISLSNTLDAQYTDANNSGTSETDLYSKTIPANTLTANGQSIDFEIGGDISNVPTATINLILYFAGSSIGATNAITATGGSWTIRGTLIRSGTGGIRMIGEIIIPSSSAKVFPFATYISSSVDFTTTNIFKLTGTAGGAGGASNQITARYWKLTLLP